MNLLIKKLIDESIQLINTFEKNESLIKILTEDFKLLLEKKDYSIDKEILDLSKNFLELSRKKYFLQKLKDYEHRCLWAEVAFKLIQFTNYSISDLFISRLKDIPDKTLFLDMSGDKPCAWSYRQIYSKTREIAALFIKTSISKPNVAIFTENCVESACCDLACLMNDILVSPLNVHFNKEILSDIFKEININIAVVDNAERCNLLLELKNEFPGLIIYILNPEISNDKEGVFYLPEQCKSLDNESIDKILNEREKFKSGEVATVLFTSGSTGIPKGVSYSIYNLVTKRFARAAALPDVGEEEVFLSYLPLYHTFGRFLEMLGAIYWGGTYVFAGNPSPETLISLFPKVNPTAFISIPLRWVQIYEHIKDIEEENILNPKTDFSIRSIIGDRLKWGISAAGYLDPEVFKFFQWHGINLCSGFGMTEATGGITMTEPGEYILNSTGRLLPGLKSRLSPEGELLINGHYIARYLNDKKPGELIPYPGSPDDDEYWLATGDIFIINSDGNYEIVDRVKDIYKNNKGQTIAPRTVENKFDGVPGVKRTFLVGDGKPYNVLFIIPDEQDQIIHNTTKDDLRNYFHHIVEASNKNLPHYERVVNYAVLERDFDKNNGEITPKDTFNRKIITNNFSNIIDDLYRTNHIDIYFQKIIIKIPRWFYRDLGILEDVIIPVETGLKNTSADKTLNIRINSENGYCLIGNLEYKIAGNMIDLGLFTRQPRLWLGNPGLIDFCPVKTGWDVPLQNISKQIFRTFSSDSSEKPVQIPDLSKSFDNDLITLNRLLSLSLFTDDESAIEAIEHIGIILAKGNIRYSDVIRRRLEALSRHPNEEIRCLAYRILLLDEPGEELNNIFPSFIDSGMTFLNEKSIEDIISSKMEKRRLESLRQRLFIYRTQLEWPSGEVTRKQFKQIFRILVNFARNHIEFYSSIRAELCSWIVLQSDPELSQDAASQFENLYLEFEQSIESSQKISDAEHNILWNKLLVFDATLDDAEIVKLKQIIAGSTFIKQSVMLAFDEFEFSLDELIEQGVWLSRLHSAHHNKPGYRISINTKSGKHFDLQMFVFDQDKKEEIIETTYWLAAVSGYPYYPRVLPRLGCCIPGVGAVSMTYLGELTVWEKIREFSACRTSEENTIKNCSWRKLFVESMAAFFRGWRNSGGRIIPGLITPTNVVVPELDFHEGATILSIEGYQTYKNPLSIIEPLNQNFYQKTKAHYPWCCKSITFEWIFDACIEGLGSKDGKKFLHDLKDHLNNNYNLKSDYSILLSQLDSYEKNLESEFYLPQVLLNAVDRYDDWEAINPNASPEAREKMIWELHRLYRLQNYPQFIRLQLYSMTYFKQTDNNFQNAFSKLLKKIKNEPDLPLTNFMELSELQNLVKNVDDRKVFSRMIFPYPLNTGKVELKQFGDKDTKQIVLTSNITDNENHIYTVREPVTPVEIGKLYRLFYIEKYPKSISNQDRCLVVIDENEKIIGGICYKMQDNNSVMIDGTVVFTPLKGKGIGKAMIEDFYSRMKINGKKAITTHFFLQQFYKKLGFEVNEKWGALVRFIS